MFVARVKNGKTTKLNKKGEHYTEPQTTVDISGLYLRWTTNYDHPDWNWFDYTDNIDEAKIHNTQRGAKQAFNWGLKNGYLELVEVKVSEL